MVADCIGVVAAFNVSLPNELPTTMRAVFAHNRHLAPKVGVFC